MKKSIINKPAMFIYFKRLGKPALAMNHYDLEAAVDSEFTAEEWKQFLSDPEVTEYIKHEMEIIRTSQVNKIVQESSDSRSIAKAQLLSSLQKLGDEKQDVDGPVFIYCYVPLNEEQKYAPNVLEVDKNGAPTISKG